jgi:hypothetical protein
VRRNKKEHQCPYCPKSFNQRVAFNMHVRLVKNEMVQPQMAFNVIFVVESTWASNRIRVLIVERLLAGTAVIINFFLTWHLILRHKKFFSCRKMLLKQHQRTHSGGGNKSFKFVVFGLLITFLVLYRKALQMQLRRMREKICW